MFKTQLNRLLIVVVLFNLCAVIGCHRGYYRRQADAEASRLIREKSVDPRWNSSDGSIEIDPQSRMFDPFSADHPPIPGDDATSHQFMHRVNGKEGYPHWHANGDTDYIESPEWQNYLPLNEKGQVVLDLDQAYQLALIHSPELQRQRETLYLSALDVSLERFGFDSQLFTGYNTFFTTQGRLRGGAGTSSSTVQNQLGANGGGLNIRKAGISGANFAVGLANTIIFNFAGNNTQSATSLIDFSLIQPLLRGAGRERVMESMTQSERTLLANVRQMERFRRGFYLQIAIGRNAGAGPNRGGNFLGTPGSATTSAGGFFGLLEQQQQIRNQEFNVRQLEGVLELFREFFYRERLDAASLKLFEIRVYGQQRSLLDAKIRYQTALDRYKIELGLPPDLDVVIEDSYLDQFEFISDDVNDRLISTGTLREQTGNALNSVDLLFKDATLEELKAGDFDRPDGLASKIEALSPFIDQAIETLEQITSNDLKQLESDFDKLSESREERLSYLKKLQGKIESGVIASDVDPGLFEAGSVRDAKDLRERLTDRTQNDSIVIRSENLKNELETIQQRIASFDSTADDLDNAKLYSYIIDEFQESIPGQLSEMNNLVLEISLLQAQARSNSIQINDVEISSEQAIEIARCMRRDWMNARASHVDNWRNIEFVADQLEAGIDLVFEGDVGNTGDNPFKLRYETGQLRAGLRFDAPIVRLAERNQYRGALIQYQQSRRSFYQFEDNVKRNLREIIRNLERNKVLFELSRQTVLVEVQNVEINRLALEEPVGPNSTSSRLGTNSARNLAEAINGLNNAQNAFLSSWVQFEVLRRNLDFDMGTMQVDGLGQWADPGVIDGSLGVRVASSLGIELDCQYCNGAQQAFMDTGAEMIPFETDSGFQGGLQPVPQYDSPSSIMETEGFLQGTPSLNQPETGYRQRLQNLGIQTSSNTTRSTKSLLSKVRIPNSSNSVSQKTQSAIESVAKVNRATRKTNPEPLQPIAVAEPTSDAVSATEVEPAQPAVIEVAKKLPTPTMLKVTPESVLARPTQRLRPRVSADELVPARSISRTEFQSRNESSSDGFSLESNPQPAEIFNSWVAPEAAVADRIQEQFMDELVTQAASLSAIAEVSPSVPETIQQTAQPQTDVPKITAQPIHVAPIQKTVPAQPPKLQVKWESPKWDSPRTPTSKPAAAKPLSTASNFSADPNWKTRSYTLDGALQRFRPNSSDK